MPEKTKKNRSVWDHSERTTVEPRYNEVLYLTNDFIYPWVIVKYMEKNLDIKYNETSL